MLSQLTVDLVQVVALLALVALVLHLNARVVALERGVKR